MKILSRSLGYYLELAARFYAFVMLTVYGTGKIAGGQFYRNGNLPDGVAETPLANAGGFDLAWTFFGYSEGYILFIGITQLIGAFMLLFERTKLLGVAILVPVLLNIIVVDFFFEISTGAMLSAITYLLAISFVAFRHREQVAEAFNAILISNKHKSESWGNKAAVWAIALVIFAVFAFLQNEMLNIVGR